MTHSLPPSLTTRPGDISDADTTSVLRRPLAVINASTYRQCLRPQPTAPQCRPHPPPRSCPLPPPLRWLWVSLTAPRRLLLLAPPMALPMAHTPPPSLTTRPGGVSNADATSVPRRPLAITNASRRMNHNHRNPGAHKDVNTEFGGLPRVRTGVVVESPTHPGIRTATTATRAPMRM